jgi:hypothetical protein
LTDKDRVLRGIRGGPMTRILTVGIALPIFRRVVNRVEVYRFESFSRRLQAVAATISGAVRVRVSGKREAKRGDGNRVRPDSHLFPEHEIQLHVSIPRCDRKGFLREGRHQRHLADRTTNGEVTNPFESFLVFAQSG